MKTVAFILPALLALTLNLTAQQRVGGQRLSPEERVKQRVEAVKKEVKLTADQEKQVTTLFTESQKRQVELFQNSGGGNWEANREKFQKLQAEETENVKKILTEEQFKAYTAYVEKQRKEMEQRRGQGGGPGGQGGPGRGQGGPGGGPR